MGQEAPVRPLALPALAGASALRAGLRSWIATPARPRPVPALADRRARAAGRRREALAVAALFAIGVLDWHVAPGATAGMLGALPLLYLASLTPATARAHFVAAAILALCAFSLVTAKAAMDGGVSLWLPQRAFGWLVLAAVAGFGLWRAQHPGAPDATSAQSTTSELNALLLSLLAHDLRTPLNVSDQALEYVERAVAANQPIDAELLLDTRARLRRSGRAIDVVLSVARADLGQLSPGGAMPALGEELRAELLAFEYEAAAAGKQLRVRLPSGSSEAFSPNPLVVRQVLAILLDNAIRYADPGEVLVEVCSSGGGFRLSVSDQGPGISARNASSEGGGSGLGLKLCRALAARAGGALVAERDGPGGSTVTLVLPVN